MPTFTRPRPLARDALISVVAPSSPFDRTRFDAGSALLAPRYRLRQGEGLFAKHGFLAGDDASRLADLQAALADREVRAILPPRGGYGATRLLPGLDPAMVRSAEQYVVGFSDITALHALWARAGLCSIHGPMLCSLADGSGAAQAAWFALLEGAAPAPLQNLTCLQTGRASGRLFGGNLTVLAALVGTPYSPPMHDTVLVLEDVGERPYRLDRTLTTMLQAGFFEGVRAVVLGQFTDCPPGSDAVSALDVLSERLSTLQVPVVCDATFGHVAENWPLLLGSHATVDAALGRVDFEAP